MHPVTKKGFWVPYDAEKQISDYIPNSTIKDIIEGIDAKHIFLCSDACFSGTFLSQTRSSFEEFHYSKIDKLKSRWALTSGGEEKVSDGKKDTSSPFSKYLLKILDDNSNKYLSVLEIINFVTKITGANAFQQPFGAHIENVGHEGGNMVFQLNDKYVISSIGTAREELNTESLTRAINKIEFRGGSLSTGKEILLVKSFVDNVDYIITENFRFNDEGQIKNRFTENKMFFGSTNNNDIEPWEIIARFATWNGLERWLEENKEYQQSKIVALRAHEDIEKVEETDSAINHRLKLVNLLQESHTMACLHCGNKISTNDSHLVEIQEIGFDLNIGNVHKECLRPVDRILGQSLYENLGKENLLINFDFDGWLQALKTGQGLITATKNTKKNGRIPIILWNPEDKFNTGNWCIEAELENGEKRIIHKGKEIERFIDSTIDGELNFFLKNLKEAKEKNNPLCYTSRRKVFGDYNQLLRSKDQDESIIEITSFIKKRYSKLLETTQNEIKDDFAPLCVLTLKTSDQLIVYSNLVIFLSDPLRLEEYLNNWKKIEFDIKDIYQLTIISDDAEFDQYMHRILKTGLQPIIDPLFDLNKDLIEGMYIVDRDSMMNNLPQENDRGSVPLNFAEDPKWKKGDKVYIEFPEVSTEKRAFGILEEDELIDEKGERTVIFKAIEDGKERDDLAFSIPSKLVRKE